MTKSIEEFIKTNFNGVSDSNYAKIRITSSKIKQEKLCHMKKCFDTDTFKKIFKHINNNYKYFTKEYIKLCHNDYTLLHGLNPSKHETIESVFTLNPIDSYFDGKITNITIYNRQNIPLYKFPSTNKFNDISKLTKYIFKINHTLFLNFEVCQSIDGTHSTEIYMNYNHQIKNDIDNLCSQIQEVIDLIEQVPTCV